MPMELFDVHENHLYGFWQLIMISKTLRERYWDEQAICRKIATKGKKGLIYF